MRIAVATAEGGGPFDGVFWRTYLKAGGPPPEVVYMLRDPHARGTLRKSVESFLLFRPPEVARLSAAQLIGRPLTDTDAAMGLHEGPRGLLPPDRLVKLDSLNSPRGRQHLRDSNVDYLVSVGSPEIFRDHVLAIPQRGALNLHNGRLPAYRGRFGTFWELYEEEDRGWITLHEMVPEVDAGRILIEESVLLRDGLFRALVEKKRVGARLLAEFLGGRRKARPVEQESRRFESGYYGWPSMGAMWELAWRRW